MLKSVPAPGDQGQTGTCVAWALAYTKTMLDHRNDGANLNAPNVLLSPIFIYMNATEDNRCQRGLFVNAAEAQLQTKGAATMSEMPFADSHGVICRPIPTSALAPAVKRPTKALGIISHSQTTGITLSELEDMKWVLSQGYPALIIIRVTSTLYENWWDKGPGEVLTDIGNDVPDSAGNAQFHALTVVGYDNSKGALRVVNSWGPRFGDGGMFWLGYGAARQILTESYTLLEP
jgi:C1A family cysteine protease